MDTSTELFHKVLRLRARNKKMRAALKIALAAMQKNIAYAIRKDEYALMEGIKAARKVLK